MGLLKYLLQKAEPRELPFRLYYHLFFPYLKNLRGATQILMSLEWFWLSKYVREEDTHFVLEYDGVEIRMAEWEDFTDAFREEHFETYTRNYTPQEGDTIVDAGAFHGLFTIYAAKKVGPDGHVIAVEPDEENRERLKENIALNDLENVTVVPEALWETEGTVRFEEKGSVTSKISEMGNKHESITLDRLAENYGRPDFVKMDIEGAEIEALRGGTEVLESGAPMAIKSYHLREGVETSELIPNLVAEAGRDVETVERFPREKTTYVV